MSIKREIVGINGDEAAALAAKQANVDVLAAYPITPQTLIVEGYSRYVHDGEVDTEFMCVESEHSALSACVTASAVGARTFTATNSVGLALMSEIVYIASSYRLPIVMAIASRALSGPINIHCDNSDSMAVRDSGWIQLYAENNQEVYDTCIQAFKISEHPNVQLPTMLMLDGFVLSHTMQNVEIFPDNIVQDFIGKRAMATTSSHKSSSVPYRLDPNNPITMGCLALYDYYFEIKRQQERAIQDAKEVIKEVNGLYDDSFGRSYGDGLVEPYKLEDAEVALVCLGTTVGTARVVAKDFRSKGIKAGLLKIRAYRPFPNQEIVKLLRNVEVVGVLDRSLSFGAQGGPIFSDIRNAFYDESVKPCLIDFIYGLGGRDMTTDIIEGVYRKLQKTSKTELVKKPIQFVGLRE